MLAGSPLAVRVGTAIRRVDDYATLGKPPCVWYHAEASEQLVDPLMRGALAPLTFVDGCVLEGPARDAAELLALGAGQDVEAGDDAMVRIAGRVARDRITSTVDPHARHGHMSHNADLMVQDASVGRSGLRVVRRGDRHAGQYP
jgi:hypothetical protein